MKPSWDEAPEWAKFLAMDQDQTWTWYAARPRMKDWFWDISLYGDDRHERATPATTLDWDFSLEPRP